MCFQLRKELNGKPLSETQDDRTLSVCWKGKKPFKNLRDVKKYFKPLALSFSSGWRTKTQFEIPPEAYLIISVSNICILFLFSVNEQKNTNKNCLIQSKGNVCLGILNGAEVGLQDYNVIGGN